MPGPAQASYPRPMLTLLLTSTLLAPVAQDSLPIEMGKSRRVGGDGVTEEEVRRSKAVRDAAPLTEANLPPPGAKDREPKLKKLAMQQADYNDWDAACRLFDAWLEELGEESLVETERGPEQASRSFLECARKAHAKGASDEAERLIAKSAELLPQPTSRHEALRWQISRDRMHEKALAGAFESAVKLNEQLQGIREDEDERIWLGERLAEAAWAAHEEEDEFERDRAMALLEQVAPQNTQYRQLQEQLQMGDNVLRNIVMYGTGGIAVVVIFGLLSGWRSRARVGSAGRSKKRNKFIDEEDELA